MQEKELIRNLQMERETHGAAPGMAEIQTDGANVPACGPSAPLGIIGCAAVGNQFDSFLKR